MNNLNLIVKDNFFKNPKEVLQHSESFDYILNNGSYPGFRSTKLDKSNSYIYNLVISEINLIFENLKFTELNLYFQKIKNQSFNGVHNEIENSGWIHTDLAILSGLVYLNIDEDMYGGTSIYEPIPQYAHHGIDINKLKTDHYKNGIVDSQVEYRLNKKLYTNLFKKTIEIKNKFNRLVVFPSECWHSAENFTSSGELERLTLVFFIK